MTQQLQSSRELNICYSPSELRKASTRLYRYSKLDHPESQIRILRLLPSDEIGTICCSLEVYALEDKPFYVAVSYEWGHHDPETEVEIRIDDRRSYVGHNLWLFLDYQRQHRKSNITAGHIRLWVDAICIHQDDLEEKMAQVHLIGDIFSQADHVLAWLGWTTAFDVPTAFRFIRAVAPYATLENGYEAARVNGLLDPEGGTYFGAATAADMWKAIVKLCQLSYWKRRWIVQEVLFARDLSILCDGHDISWLDLQLTLAFVEQSRIGYIHRALEATVPWKIYRYRTGYTLTQPKLSSEPEAGNNNETRRTPDLRMLTIDFASTECSVVHDRIYSLLNLASERHQLNANYAFSCFELFKGVLNVNYVMSDWEWPAQLVKLLNLNKPLEELPTRDSSSIILLNIPIEGLKSVRDTSEEWDSTSNVEVTVSRSEKARLKLQKLSCGPDICEDTFIQDGILVRIRKALWAAFEFVIKQTWRNRASRWLPWLFHLPSLLLKYFKSGFRRLQTVTLDDDTQLHSYQECKRGDIFLPAECGTFGLVMRNNDEVWIPIGFAKYVDGQRNRPGFSLLTDEERYSQSELERRRLLLDGEEVVSGGPRCFNNSILACLFLPSEDIEKWLGECYTEHQEEGSGLNVLFDAAHYVQLFR